MGANGKNVDMRRITIVLLAGLLVVGLVAAPAAADRDPYTGNFPHGSWVGLQAELFGEPDVRELPTGEWARLFLGWEDATAPQREHFRDTVIVEFYRDGVLQSNIGMDLVDDEGSYRVFFDLAEPPGAANSEQVWMVRMTFTEDHWDGVSWTEAGVYEDDRTIVWTPRGQFPSGDYPPSNW